MTTAQEVQKRNNKAQHLRVIQVEDGDCFVSSEEGLILYKVTHGDGKENSCTAAILPEDPRQIRNSGASISWQ